MKNISASEIIKRLQLQPHPEGGFYRETYRSTDRLSLSSLPPRYLADRSVSTSIYYLLTSDTFSTMHRVKSDEVFHFYMGDPVEQLRLFPDGSSSVIILGHDIVAGHEPQTLVPLGVWQGARLCRGGSYALLGATVAPGFDFADYEEGFRDSLVSSYADQDVLISALTRK